MLASAIREILEEEEEVQLHREALESLLRRYSMRAYESLEEWIKRGQTRGDWIHLSPGECAVRREQETLRLESLMGTLQHELKRTRKKLASVKQMKQRARRILVEQAASQHKQRY
jgi:hypothetical protein